MWIEWNGGECPVSGENLVEVLLRFDRNNGKESSGEPESAKNFRWTHTGSLGDIVAYKVVES